MPAAHRFTPDRDLFQRLIEQVPAVVFVDSHEPWWQTLYISPQATEVLGDPPERWIADPGLGERRVHPDDHERVMSRWREVVRTGERYDVEYRYLHPDGRVLWLHERQRLIFDEDGVPRYWLGLIEDVTDVHGAADELRASESRFRTLAEQLPAVVYIDSDESEPESLYVSPNCEEVLGHTAESYLASRTKFRQTVHPDDVETFFTAWQTAVRDGSPFSLEYRFVRPDGHPVWVRDSAHLIRNVEGERLYWQGVILDVSEAKRFEQELAASERRYRTLVEQLPAVIYEMGPDDARRTLFVSRHVEQVLGYSRAEWLDQPDIWVELLHPDDREIELAAHDLQSTTGDPWHREYRLIAADGREVWVRDQAVLSVDEGGRRSWQGVMLDITAQKQAEERLVDARNQMEFRVLERTQELEDANEMMTLEIGERRRIEAELREAQDRYRRLVEHLPAVVYVWEVDPDPHAPQYYTSPQIEDVLGYSSVEWASEHLWVDRLHPHDRSEVLAAAMRSEATGEPFDVECRYLARDGRVVWVWDRATLLSRGTDGRPKLFQGVMLDITRRKEAEAQAQEAEKRFRLLAERGPAIAYTWDPHTPDRSFTFLGSRIVELLGYELDRWLSFDWFLSIVHPDDRDVMVEASLRVAGSGDPWSLDYRVIAADGRIVWVHDEGHLLAADEEGSPLLFQGALLDVTERRETERSLAEAEAKYRGLVEEMPAVAWSSSYDPRTDRVRMLYVGPQAVEVFGYTAEELMSEPGHFERLLHPDDRDRVMVADRATISTGSDWQQEYRVITREGSVKWIHSVARRSSQADRVPVVWHGVAIDVTSTREAETGVDREVDAAGDANR